MSEPVVVTKPDGPVVVVTNSASELAAEVAAKVDGLFDADNTILESRLSPETIEALNYARAGISEGSDYVVYGSAYDIPTDGVTDARPAVEAAVNAAVALAQTGKRVTLRLPAGTLLMNTGVTIDAAKSWINCGIALPVGLSGYLTIEGDSGGATEFKMTANCLNVFTWNRTADYQTAQNVTLRYLNVDKDGTGGKGHILLGNIPGGLNRQQRMNYLNLKVENSRIRNVPVAATGQTPFLFGVIHLGHHPNAQQDGTQATQLAMEATQTSSINITYRNITVEGGAGAVNVASWLNSNGYQSAGPTNHFYDQIEVHGIKHIKPARTIVNSETSVFVVGGGFGNRVRVSDIYSEGVADDVLEIGCCQDFEGSDIRSKDAYKVCIYIRVSQPPINVDSQRFVINGAYVRNTPDLTAAVNGAGTSNPGASSKPFTFETDNGVSCGTLVMNRLTWESTGQTSAITQRSNMFAELKSNFRAAYFNDCAAIIKDYTFAGSISGDLSVFYFAPSQGNPTVRLRNFNVVFAGAQGSSAPALTFHAVKAEGTAPNLLIDGLDTDMSGFTFSTNGGSTQEVCLSKGTASNLVADLRGIRRKGTAVAGAGTVDRRSIRVGTSGTKLISVDKCDFSSNGSALAADIYFESATTNRQNLRLGRNSYLAFPAATVIDASAITGGAYTYRNYTGRQVVVQVVGGTVTLVEWGDNNNVFTALDGIAGRFLCDAGQRIRVTYNTNKPTVTIFPMEG